MPPDAMLRIEWLHRTDRFKKDRECRNCEDEPTMKLTRGGKAVAYLCEQHARRMAEQEELRFPEAPLKTKSKSPSNSRGGNSPPF